MARLVGPTYETIYDAVDIWRNKCLLDDGSIFSNDRVWTIENVKQLEKYFVQQPLMDNRSFLEKLKVQLDNVSDSAKQLMAEMLWVMYLFPSKISAETKRTHIIKVYSWSQSNLNADHSLLQKPLASGIGHTGTAYNTLRDREVAFFIAVLDAWKNLESHKRSALVMDPWAFGGWIDSISGSEIRQLRHILLYLLFPDHYERISSGKHKLQIAEAFDSLNESTVAGIEATVSNWLRVDKRIYSTREKLQASMPEQKLDFYLPNIRDRWLDNKGAGVDELAIEQKDSYRHFWIEKTIVSGRPDRESGEHALGKALWSPQKSKDGRDIYKNMREVKANDVVLHLTDNKGMSGVSIVRASVDDSFIGISGSDWAGQKGYRIQLSEYKSLDPILDRSWFLKSTKYTPRLQALLEAGHSLFYAKNYDLNQGAYLTAAPEELITPRILSRSATA